MKSREDFVSILDFEAYLLDYFAAKAMQGTMATIGDYDNVNYERIATDAYNMAKTMLKISQTKK